MRSNIYLRFSCLLITAVVMWSCVSTAPTWSRLNTSHFPRQLTAIAFPNGLEITSTRGMVWGAWRVSATGSNSLLASSGQDDEEFFTIGVRGIQCTNAVVGTVECNMVLTRSKKTGGHTCMIVGQQVGRIDIVCPARLQY